MVVGGAIGRGSVNSGVGEGRAGTNGGKSSIVLVIFLNCFPLSLNLRLKHFGKVQSWQGGAAYYRIECSA